MTTNSRKKRSKFDESSEANCERKLIVFTDNCQVVPDNKKYGQNCGVDMTVCINERVGPTYTCVVDYYVI